MPFDREQNPTGPSVASGISAGGNITGNIQNAPGAQNVTLNQQVTGTDDDKVSEIRRQLRELRDAVERDPAQLAEPRDCLKEISAIEQHLDGAETDPTTLRCLARSVYRHCGEVSGLATIAAFVLQAITAVF